MNEISSPHNPHFKRWQSLLESKGIKKEGLALVSGEKLILELIQQDPSRIEEILLPPKKDFNGDPKLRTTRLSSPLFNALDVIGTHSPLAVVRIAPLPEWRQEPPKGLELIVSLSDPANLGALLRSAEAFAVSRVILTRECASPYLPKAVKAASLATFRLNLAVTGSIRELKIENALALHMEGEDISTFTWPKDVYLILGEEGQGLPEQLKVKRLKLAMAGQLESLNATVAASLAMYTYRLKTGLSGTAGR